MTPLTRLLFGLIVLYRWTLSPFVGRHCRFLPTCSEYALDALAKHGAFCGSTLILRRLARCHPWGGSGFDPVPEPRPSAGTCPGSSQPFPAQRGSCDRAGSLATTPTDP